jgi:hypothetical protein
MAYAGPENFMGRWALDIAGGGAGWLEFTDQGGWFDGSVLWIGGSVIPFDHVYFDGDTLYATKTRSMERKNGDVSKKQIITDVVTATVSGDQITGARRSPKGDARGVDETKFTGKRIPAPGPKPDLKKVKFGKAIELFNGKDLAGWTLTDANALNGWFVEDGILCNVPKKEKGKSAGNLRTEKEFEDFELELEANVAEHGNSGVYLRGIYEVQVEDSHGKPLDPHNMGAIYSRITPSEAAEKPAGEWQKLKMTLVDRHVTVKLNGKTIIDNEPLAGCTGGALWSDEFKPGPIYLQGDHTAIKYRNIKLRPVVKK